MKGVVATAVFEAKNYSEHNLKQGFIDDCTEWYNDRNELCHVFRSYKDADDSKFFVMASRLILDLIQFGVECPLTNEEIDSL